jgi:hemerythrin
MDESRPSYWSDTLLTGVEAIDEQHRILFATLQNFESGPSADLRQMEHVVRDLLAYAIYHFDTEEHLMRRYGYDVAEPHQAAMHIQQHRSFSRRVVELRADARGGKAGSPEALLAFLRDWLVLHIGSTDRQLSGFILARTAGRSR